MSVPGWSQTTLGECATWYSGGTPRTSEPTFWNGNIPWISSGSLTSFYIQDSERRVTQAGVENGTRLVPEGTVIFVVRGMSLKTEFRVGITKRSVAFGQDCKALIAKPMILPEFLANVLRSKSPEILTMVEEAGHGTGTLQTDTMKALSVPLPPLAEQRQILTLLTALDELIALLQQTNTTLEAMAQAIFKSWFIDFDPVHAKAEGREPEGMEAETASLFPSQFEESELGLIPKGWRVVSVQEAFEINPRRNLAKGISAPYLDMANAPTTGHRPHHIGERVPGSGVKFKNGDTLLAKITPCLENGKTAYVDFLKEAEVGWGSTEFIVMAPKPPLPPYFGYLLARSPAFRAHAVQSMTGSSGRQRVEIGRLAQYKLVAPDSTVALAFHRLVDPLRARIALGDEQRKTLSVLRDTLLPRLISGKLRIPEAQEAVEDALA